MSDDDETDSPGDLFSNEEIEAMSEELRHMVTSVDPNDLVRWFDREGNQISMQRMIELSADENYRHLAHDVIGDVYISTVWLALDHNTDRQRSLLFGLDHTVDERPLIFETMVFASVPREDGYLLPHGSGECQRYATEAEALQGHADLVTLIRATTPDLPPMPLTRWQRFKNLFRRHHVTSTMDATDA